MLIRSEPQVPGRAAPSAKPAVTEVRASPRGSLRLVAEEPGRHQVACVGPIVVLVLHAQPTLATVEALRAGRQHALQHAGTPSHQLVAGSNNNKAGRPREWRGSGAADLGKVSHLIVLAERNVAPNPETRQGFASLLREAAGSTGAEAVVFEGQGMGGLMVRSVVRLIHAAARVYFPHRVTADLEEACAFLCDIHADPPVISPRSLARQVRALAGSRR